MKIILIALAFIATTCARSISTDYLPPTEDYSGAGTTAYETNTLEYEPAHSLSDDGYRYKTVKRYRLRHRRDVNELTSYLPPQAASSPAVSYAAPAQEVSYEAESAPEVAYSAPQSYESSSYESAASEPAHTLANDGYRYKTVKRYRLRHRRDVNELTSYLPPQAASSPAVSYAAPAQEVSYEAESAPEVAYSAPQSYESSSYESAASEPAHTLANDGYRYKTVKRYRLRHRRDVNELTSYLPPQAASSPAVAYAAPAQEVSYEAESAPEVAYSAPQSYESSSYESAASEPAHTLASDGYRYKTVKRYRLRHRRDVNELTSYLPPQAASSPAVSYAAPAQEASYEAESAPEVAYSAPQSYESSSYESAASEPAHTLANDGYRYKTVKRYRLRHRRDVNELTSYLPPQAASSPAVSYAAPAQVASYEAESAPEVAYSAPQSYESSSYESAASEPAHTLANDGYRYKTVKRYRLRHRRDVNELTSYLPPQAASSPAVSYAAPAQEASYEAESAPEVAYSAPQSYESSSYESAASEPAHTLANDGYRYKTVKRYRLRHRRDVNELTSYLPPQAASSPAVSYAAPAQVASYEAESAPEVAYSAPQSYESSSYESAASEPAHTLANDGYRYKTVKRYRLRHRRDVNELTSYLPPQAASSPAVSYAAPAQEVSYEAESAPEVAYSAPQSYESSSYESAASEPAHTLASDGYRYKTVKRYRLRHRRDVNELTSYLPPQAASSPAISYAAPAQAASYEAESAPEVAYSAPQSYESSSYESAASEPAHTLANDGYRYKTVKRYRLRHRF